VLVLDVDGLLQPGRDRAGVDASVAA
jgi:hypothetical protein